MDFGCMRRIKIGILPALYATLLSSDKALLLTSDVKRKRKWSKEGGVVMNVFGRIEEAFTLPWFWKEKFGLGRWRMLELSRSLWLQKI